MVFYVMQVDCYKRNYSSQVCTTKCKFHFECSREYARQLANKLREKETEKK